MRAIAAAVILLALGCDHRSRAGDACPVMIPSAKCEDATAALYCEDGHFIEGRCRGPKGCEEIQMGNLYQMTCDISANLEGDRCLRAAPEGSGIVLITPNPGTCSTDGRDLIYCRDGAYHRDHCDGPNRCTTGSDGMSACDRLAQ